MADQKKLDQLLVRESEAGRIDGVKLLIDAGADVHAENDFALREASYCGRTQVVKLLLDAGADVHANKDLALCLASNNGHTEIVKILEAAMAASPARPAAAARPEAPAP